MLRTSPLWKILTLCLITHAGAALAQTKPAETPPKQVQTPAKQAQTPAKPSDAPPQLDNIEGGRSPAVALPPPKSARGGTRVTEKKQGGRVTEVKVQAGPSTYTMKPNAPAGNAVVGDVQSGNGIRPPQWTLFEFGPGKKKPVEEAAADTVDAPPPQTVKPAKSAK